MKKYSANQNVVMEVALKAIELGLLFIGAVAAHNDMFLLAICLMAATFGVLCYDRSRYGDDDEDDDNNK